MSLQSSLFAPKRKSVEKQIHKLLIAVAVMTGMIIIALVVMMLSINNQYSNVLQNANTAADFNSEFKSTLDSQMYNHVIKPRTEKSVEELPMEELDNAEAVLMRLESSTTLKDNRWRIQSMLDMFTNLRKYMIEIAREESYDIRMELLERNIRGETGLTELIETYMHEFIDDEVREMARLRKVISRQTVVVVACVAAGAVFLSIMLILSSVRISRSITEPISALSQKARKFGSGNFSPSHIETDIIELETLNDGFDDMAGKINSLMDKQMEDERSLHKAELELLQAQINPHFLYNTLDSIAILAESERSEDVVNMVTNLSTFFRSSLNRGKDIISLRAECAQVRSYLEIQSVRYSDILEYEIHIPEMFMDVTVPKLILQPLVENALYHGIKNRRGMGKITITAEERGDDLLLRVQDNGAGMDEEQVNALKSGVYEDRHTGLGLVNVHKRIRLYCGEKYGLSFESEKAIGTTVSVLLPMHQDFVGKEETV